MAQKLRYIQQLSGMIQAIFMFFSPFDCFHSGDNKTEKAARSAQVALVDNGNMTDTLGFIEGNFDKLSIRTGHPPGIS